MKNAGKGVAWLRRLCIEFRMNNIMVFVSLHVYNSSSFYLNFFCFDTSSIHPSIHSADVPTLYQAQLQMLEYRTTTLNKTDDVPAVPNVYPAGGEKGGCTGP